MRLEEQHVLHGRPNGRIELSYTPRRARSASAATASVGSRHEVVLKITPLLDTMLLPWPVLIPWLQFTKAGG